MAKWYSVLFSILCLSWVDAISLLGEPIFFPLSPTDPIFISRMFNPNSTLVMRCIKRKRTEDMSPLMEPNMCLKSYVEKFKPTADATEICRSNREYLDCIDRAMDGLDDMCLWNDEEETVYRYPLKAFEASLDYMCNDNSKQYNAFVKANGRLCVTENEDLLQECVDAFEVKDSLNYDHDNCEKAWEFYGCCEDKLYDGCEDDIVEKAMKMLVEGLAVTPCRVQAPKFVGFTISEEHKNLPKVLPDNVVVEIQENKEGNMENSSAASTDKGVDSGATRCTSFLVWTLLLYKLIAA